MPVISKIVSELVKAVAGPGFFETTNGHQCTRINQIGEGKDWGNKISENSGGISLRPIRPRWELSRSHEPAVARVTARETPHVLGLG